MSYSVFADYYDALTQNVKYHERADYFCSLLEKLNHAAGLTLDLACGTGSLTIEFAKRGFDIYGIDASVEMLSLARQKAVEEGLDLLFLYQKMQSLDLYGTVDTVICALDSINHLTAAKDVQATFAKVSLFMNPGGYFIFDCNTVYKHQTILGNQTYIYDTDKVFCAWQNHYDEKTERVSIELDFFEKQPSHMYLRSSEHFYERAYSPEQLSEWLVQAGFEAPVFYDELTFNPPRPNSERLVVVAKKR